MIVGGWVFPLEPPPGRRDPMVSPATGRRSQRLKSDLWSYLENLSSADRALEENVIELAPSYAASVTGADDNPKIISFGEPDPRP